MSDRDTSDAALVAQWRKPRVPKPGGRCTTCGGTDTAPGGDCAYCLGSELAAAIARRIAEGERLNRLRKAAQKLVDYRKRAGAIAFQLEKADDYINAIEDALVAEEPEP